jgi:hypothetical protein
MTAKICLMTPSQQQRLNVLLTKYNDILLNSMRLAVTEDLISLIILNKDDKEFELSNLLQDKTALSNYVIRQFLKQNSGGVLKDLGKLEDPLKDVRKRFGHQQKKIRFSDDQE